MAHRCLHPQPPPPRTRAHRPAQHRTHTRAYTRYKFTEAQVHTRASPERVHSLQPHPYCNLKSHPRLYRRDPPTTEHAHTSLHHPGEAPTRPSPDFGSPKVWGAWTSIHTPTSTLHPSKHIHRPTGHLSPPRRAQGPTLLQTLSLARSGERPVWGGPTLKDGPSGLIAGRGRRGTRGRILSSFPSSLRSLPPTPGYCCCIAGVARAPRELLGWAGRGA